MKRQLPFAVLAALGAFALFVLAGVPLTYQAHAQASPSVAVSLSSASVEEGAAIAVTMSFEEISLLRFWRSRFVDHPTNRRFP